MGRRHLLGSSILRELARPRRPPRLPIIIIDLHPLKALIMTVATGDFLQLLDSCRWTILTSLPAWPPILLPFSLMLAWTLPLQTRTPLPCRDLLILLDNPAPDQLSRIVQARAPATLGLAPTL